MYCRAKRAEISGAGGRRELLKGRLSTFNFENERSSRHGRIALTGLVYIVLVACPPPSPQSNALQIRVASSAGCAMLCWEQKAKYKMLFY